MHCIDCEFFTSNTLVKLTICDGFYPDGDFLPPGGVFFPVLKTRTLVQVAFPDAMMYEAFISGCPLLEELFLHYDDDNQHPAWGGAVSSPSLKRLTIQHNWPNHREEAHEGCWFLTPSLEYLEYSSYVAQQYVVDLGSLVEARLDLRSWQRPVDESESDEDESDEDESDEDESDEDESDEDESDEDESDGDTEDIFGDVMPLVAGISNVKTLHLSSDSLEVFYLCCDTMPVFHNLLKLSFESDKEIGWQVVPLLLNNSPNLETLIIKGLVHQVTDSCGDACACKPKKMEKGVCCLSTCPVKVLSISGYQGTCRELKQMRHFLANLKCLETVKLGVHRQDYDRYPEFHQTLASISSDFFCFYLSLLLSKLFFL